MLIVSHDRTLLNLLDMTAELSPKGIQRFGGNYTEFTEQKDVEKNALHQQLQNKEKELRKARDKERDAAERQNKLNARGKKKQEKAGVARIMMNTLRHFLTIACCSSLLSCAQAPAPAEQSAVAPAAAINNNPATA